MRLLRRGNDGQLSLTDDLPDSEIPPYAILSHTWLRKQNGVELELLFRELQSIAVDQLSHKAGYLKVRLCADQAKLDGYDYCWVDTCCINKDSERELGEAIRSMFRWYRQASRCYVHLADVDPSQEQYASGAWLEDFRRSRWFTRGWTLPELIAPRDLQFYSVHGAKLGSKYDLRQEISSITGIPISALISNNASTFSIEERLSWAQRRETSLVEDSAYSLFGLFDIHLPLLYGERQGAMKRLRRELGLREQALSPPLAMESKEPDQNYRRVHVTIVYWRLDDVHDVVRVLTEVFRKLYRYEVHQQPLPCYEHMEHNWPWLTEPEIQPQDLQIMYYLGSTLRTGQLPLGRDIYANDVFQGLVAVPSAPFNQIDELYPYEQHTGDGYATQPNRFRKHWFSNLTLLPQLDCDVFVVLDSYIHSLENASSVSELTYLHDDEPGRFSMVVAGYNRSGQPPVGSLSWHMASVLKRLVPSRYGQAPQGLNSIRMLKAVMEKELSDTMVMYWLGPQSICLSPLDTQSGSR